MASEVMVDPGTLREQVKEKYREVALNPRGSFHFHTGRPLAARLGYDESVIASFPESAVETFAGVANPFSLRSLMEGSGWSIWGRVEDSTVSWLPCRLAPKDMSSVWT